MSVLAAAGRFQIEGCDVHKPEAPEQNVPAAGCIHDVVARESKLAADVTRLKWSLLVYEGSDPAFKQQLCKLWAVEAKQHRRQSLVIGDERST